MKHIQLCLALLTARLMFDDFVGYWWFHIKNILSLDIFLCRAYNRGLIFIHIALCKNHHNGTKRVLKWNLNIYTI